MACRCKTCTHGTDHMPHTAQGAYPCPDSPVGIILTHDWPSQRPAACPSLVYAALLAQTGVVKWGRDGAFAARTRSKTAADPPPEWAVLKHGIPPGYVSCAQQQHGVDGSCEAAVGPRGLPELGELLLHMQSVPWTTGGSKKTNQGTSPIAIHTMHTPTPVHTHLNMQRTCSCSKRLGR